MLDCNHVEGFQNSEKLETLYGFGGRHFRNRDISMDFGQPLQVTAWLPCNETQPNMVSLLKLLCALSSYGLDFFIFQAV